MYVMPYLGNLLRTLELDLVVEVGLAVLGRAVGLKTRIGHTIGLRAPISIPRSMVLMGTK